MSIVNNEPAKSGFPVTGENAITADEIQELINTGHVVFIKPKLGIAVVDGFKRYKLPKSYSSK